MSKDKVKSMQTLKREIQVFQGLHHPCIIDVIEVNSHIAYLCVCAVFLFVYLCGACVLCLLI